MRSLRKDLWIFCTFLGLYLGGVVYYKARGLSPSDAFPLFAWDLFIYAPNRVTEQSILIQQVDDRVLSPARDLRDYWKPTKKNDAANYFAVPHLLTEAVRNNQVEEVRRIEERIRARFFMGARSLRFQLLEKNYDPLEYWSDKSKATTTVISEFNFVAPKNSFEEAPEL